MSYNKARVYLRKDPCICFKEAYALFKDPNEDYDMLKTLAGKALSKIEDGTLPRTDPYKALTDEELKSRFDSLINHPDPLVRLRVKPNEELRPLMEQLKDESMRNDMIHWDHVTRLARLASIDALERVEFHVGVFIPYEKELENLKLCDEIVTRCIKEPEAYEKFCRHIRFKGSSIPREEEEDYYEDLVF